MRFLCPLQIIPFSATQFEPDLASLFTFPVKFLRNPMVHCSLPVISNDSNNKKGWIVWRRSPHSQAWHTVASLLFSHLSAPPSAATLYSISSLILSLSAAVLFIQPLVSVPATNAATPLFALCAVPSSAFKVFLPPVLHPSLSRSCRGAEYW